MPWRRPGRVMVHMVRRVLHRYPVTRGMVTYSLVWPTSNVVQQFLDPHKTEFDPKQTFRFLIFGTFVTAPTVFVWIKIASKLVKGNTFKHALLKAFYDIMLFAPVGQSQFYFGISLLEGRSIDDCVKEVEEKLFSSWKVACCFWPFVQTFNFWYVREKNRVMVISLGSFVWTVFLSYMHHSDGENLPAFFRPQPKLKADESLGSVATLENKTELSANKETVDERPSQARGLGKLEQALDICKGKMQLEIKCKPSDDLNSGNQVSESNIITKDIKEGK